MAARGEALRAAMRERRQKLFAGWSLGRRTTQGTAPASSWWTLPRGSAWDAALEARRPYQAPATPDDMVYGPFRCRGIGPIQEYRNRKYHAAHRKQG